MNSKTNHLSSENQKKRATLKRLRNVGIGSAAITAMGSSEWIKPIVSQVILPAHAQTTTACATPFIFAEMGDCSSGVAIDVRIEPQPGFPVRILSAPTLTTTPTSLPHPNGSWSDTPAAPAAPFDATETNPYPILMRGQVLNETISCSIPATTTPGQNGEAITEMLLVLEYACIGGGVVETIRVDLLDLI